MKANLIKTLKNNAELVDIKAGRSARRNFPGVDFENAVLIINGKIATPDTIIKDNDIVTLRQFPGDANDADNWWIYTFIIPFGFIIQPAVMSYTAKQQADEAQRELEKIKKLTNQPEIDNSPFLRGANNTIATGKSQPYFCGRNFLTPYLFTKPYYKISGTDGETQEVYNVLEGGFKDIVLNKIGIGDTTIKEFAETTPQNGVYTISEGLFANGQLEIRQNGAAFSTLTQLNTKVNSNVINREIIPEYKVTAGNGEHLILSLDPNAQNVEVCINFPYGLYKYDDNNDRQPAEVTITPEYSLDGGSTWTAFTFNQNGTLSNIFKKNVTKSIRYVATKNFTYSNYQTLATNSQNSILVRVRSNAPDDQKVRADCYVYFYQSKIFDPLKSSAPAGILDDGGTAGLVECLNVEERERAYSCVIGLKLVATKNNEDKLSQINIIATSTARTWNGSAWSETKAPTRNPAAIALEIYTSDTHPASRYADTEIDLDAFGALYEYCVNNDIYFDDVITQAQKKDAEIQKIADVCGCAFYKDIYGRISVAIDQAQENAVAVYNPQNIISLTNKKTFARRVDALRIKYIDSTNDTYKQNTYTVTRLENGQPVTIDENSIIKEIDVKGITRQSQIVKYARRLMAVDELRPVTTTLKIGAEGVYFTPYAKIGIQDPSINRDAQDAVIAGVTYQGGLLKKITLKNSVTFTDPQKLYGVVINTTSANGASPLALKVSGTGTTRELNVLTTYSASATHQPEANNVVSFGELDENGEFTKITHEYVITRIARTSGGFNLDLQEYNEAIYDSGVIPAYKPLINSTPTPAAGEIPPDAVTHEELDEAVTAVNSDSVQAAVDTTIRGTRFTNKYKVLPVETSLEDILQRLDEDAQDSAAAVSILDDEIIIKVEDTERALRAIIDITADEIYQAVENGDEQTRGYVDTKAGQITAAVEEMASELTGLINVQAGAVTALVEGGGAAGEMSLSLNLPILIDATKRAELVTASTEAKVAAVYALVEGTSYYGIKGNASNAAVKALWDDAVAAGLIASQIVLSADQINIAGKTIYTSSKTEAISAADAAAAQSAAISAAASDATEKANAAQSAAETYADSAASDAQAAAETTAAADATTKANNAKSEAISAAATDATSKRNDIAQKLGYANYDAMVTAAQNGQTIIDGGYLRTSLIEVEDLLAQNITLDAAGYIESSNYAEDTSGVPTAGFKLDAANNKIKSYDMQANGGTFENILVQDSEFKGVANVNALNLIARAGDVEICDGLNQTDPFTKYRVTRMTNLASGKLRVEVEIYGFSGSVTVYATSGDQEITIGTATTQTTLTKDIDVVPGELIFRLSSASATIHFHIKTDYRNDLLGAMMKTTIHYNN